MTFATITLPWPDKRLSPNARIHHMALHRAKKAAKNTAHAIALEAKLSRLQASSLRVRYIFHPPTAHDRDDDNLVSQMKSARDGIALATGVDDSKWTTAHVIESVVKGGCVKVEIEWDEVPA